MTSVEYDLDTSGGLMPQIQALIAPPVLEDSCKKKKEKERRYRRPGRTINHDSCDSCKEGGDLICCDRCPAAFHLTCHDPPLSDDDLPSGEWLCHRCKVTPEIEEGETESMDVDTVNPLNVLISAAATRNPSQYSLPCEFSCNIQLPGSSRKIKKENSRCGKKAPHELDSGIVHLPAKLCFNCKKSCRRAALMQCDFCPLLFHFDCVDPPLTAPPAGRWMCPNHAEHLVDQKLLNSVSLSERVKLWDKFCGPISQDAVKLQFLNKIGRRHPPFRRKVKLPRRVCICVPGSVVQQRHHPPSLLPTLKTALKTESIFQSVVSGTSSPFEQSEWLSQIVSFQTNVAKHLGSGEPESKTILKLTNGSESGPEDIKVKAENKGKLSYPKSGKGFLSKWQDISSDGSLASRESIPSSLMSVLNNLQSTLDSSDSSTFNQLDEKLIKVLAFQRLQQLLPPKSKDDDPAHQAPKELRGRAVLSPLDRKLPPVSMSYRCLHLGLGADMDVYFPFYGHCNYVSARHASIFYDENAKQYELLNYSCYGTVVDSVLFSTESIERSRSPPPPHSLSAAVRKLAKNTPRMADAAPVTTRPPALVSRENLQKNVKPCKCQAGSSEAVEDNGWEGAAILHHGSFIQCGCLQFVFGITEYGFRLEPHKRRTCS